jgi:uncharacterized protein (TIGR03382 family)
MALEQERRQMKLACALVAVAGLAAAASAQTFVLGPTPATIPDSNAGGVTIGSGAVAGTQPTIATVSVSLDMVHTWVGDLVATLTYTPTAGAPVSIDLFNRIGRVSTGFGDSSNFSGAYVFEDGGADIWAAAGAVGDLAVVGPGTYAATGANSATALSLNAAFAGLDSSGTWSLLVADLAGGDLGEIRNASVTITTIPTPGALALLGLGGLVAGRRRR